VIARHQTSSVRIALPRPAPSRTGRRLLTSFLSSGLYRRLRNFTGSAGQCWRFCVNAPLAGFHRRWGFKPRPETKQQYYKAIAAMCQRKKEASRLMLEPNRFTA